MGKNMRGKLTKIKTLCNLSNCQNKVDFFSDPFNINRQLSLGPTNVHFSLSFAGVLLIILDCFQY